MTKHNDPFDAAEYADYRAHGVFDPRVVQVCEDETIGRFVCASCETQSTVVPLAEAISLMDYHEDTPTHRRLERRLQAEWDAQYPIAPYIGINSNGRSW